MTTASIINDDGLCFYHGGKMHHVTRGNINFDTIKACVLEKKFDEIEGLLNPFSVIEKKSNGLLRVEDNQVFYKQDELPETLVNRLMDIVSAGHGDITPYILFCQNVYANPSKNSRTQLYKFIEHKEMPITDDGHILGYKGVSDDYMDKYTGKFSNAIGSVNRMERRDVDDDCNHHCSTGFHVGTKSYADGWAGYDGHVMIVKYNPKDAVSVPSDHSFEKLRVTCYQVIDEIPKEERENVALPGQIYSESETGLQESEKLSYSDNLHGDNWYKARNFIETARDNGDDTVSKSVLDKEFGVSQWYTPEWDDLLEETETIDDGFKLLLHGSEDGKSLADLLDEATEDEDWD